MKDDGTTCDHCGRVVQLDSEEFLCGEAVGTDAERWNCEPCSSGSGRPIVEALMALGAAMRSAGLSGENVHREVMTATESEMRASLAQLFYQHEPSTHRQG